jgi:hypothetical protein
LSAELKFDAKRAKPFGLQLSAPEGGFALSDRCFSAGRNLPSAIGQKSDDLMIGMISMSRLFCSLYPKKSIDRLLTGR